MGATERHGVRDQVTVIGTLRRKLIAGMRLSRLALLLCIQERIRLDPAGRIQPAWIGDPTACGCYRSVETGDAAAERLDVLPDLGGFGRRLVVPVSPFDRPSISCSGSAARRAA